MVGEKMIYEERTFINEQQTSKLLEYFEINSNQKREEKQIIYDYHTEGNFRLVKTSNYVKIDFKPNSAIENENQFLNEIKRLLCNFHRGGVKSC